MADGRASRAGSSSPCWPSRTWSSRCPAVGGRRPRTRPRVDDGGPPAPAAACWPGPLLLLGIAIATYVASEVGVSNWLVRFLDPAPLTTATLALSLYWAGLTVGRLVSSAIADRFDHLRFTLVCALLMAALLAVGRPRPDAAAVDRGLRARRRRVRPGLPDDRRDRRRAVPGASASVGGSLTGMA